MSLLSLRAFPWEELEQEAQEFVHPITGNPILLAYASSAPPPIALKKAMEAECSPNPRIRDAAVNLWHELWPIAVESDAVQLEEVSGHLRRLATDPDPGVRKHAQFWLYQEEDASPEDFSNLVVPIHDLQLVHTCLNRGQWHSELAVRLLKFALDPIRPGTIDWEDWEQEKARQNTLFPLFETRNLDWGDWEQEFEPICTYFRHGPLPPLTDEHLRLWKIYQLFPAMTTASEDDRLRLGRRILEEGQGRLREPGAALLGLAGEAGRADLLSLMAEPDAQKARLGRLGWSCSPLPEGRQSLQSWLESGNRETLGEAIEALTWRSTWEPSSCAALLRLAGDKDWLVQDRFTGQDFPIPSWWLASEVLDDLLNLGTDLGSWLLPEEAIPIAPVGLLPSRHCLIQALMALARIWTGRRRQHVLATLFWNQTPNPYSSTPRGELPHGNPALHDFFAGFLEDPDPGVRYEAIDHFFDGHPSLDRFRNAPLDPDPEVQGALAKAVVRNRTWLPSSREFLSRLANEGHLGAAMAALDALLPEMGQSERQTWHPRLKEALESPSFWGQACQTLSGSFRWPWGNASAPIGALVHGLGGELENLVFTLQRGEGPWPEDLVRSRWYTVFALNLLPPGDRKRWSRLLEQLAGHPNSEWAECAMKSLEDHPLPEGIHALRSLAERFPVRVSRLLGVLGTGESLDALRLMADSKDPFWRRVSAIGLGWHGDVQSLNTLVDLLQDPVPTVRRRALRMLGQRKEQALETRLTESLRDVDPKIRRAAVRGYLDLKPEDAALLAAWAWSRMGLMLEEIISPSWYQFPGTARFLLQEASRTTIDLEAEYSGIAQGQTPPGWTSLHGGQREARYERRTP